MLPLKPASELQCLADQNYKEPQISRKAIDAEVCQWPFLFIRMIELIIAALAYILGCFISYWMLKTEHEAESEVFTKGDKVISILLSVFSWVMILIMMARAWFGKIGKGYWDKPVKKQAE